MIQTTPRAWSTIHIRLTRRDPAALAILFFQYARACPLHVIVSDPPTQWKYEPPMNQIEPFVGLLKQHWNRIRIFRYVELPFHRSKLEGTLLTLLPDKKGIPDGRTSV